MCLDSTESLTSRASRIVANSASETAVSMVISFRRAGATTWSSSSAIRSRAAGARGPRRRRRRAAPASRPTPRARGRPARRDRRASTGGRERVGGAARDRPQRHEGPPAVVRRPDRRPERDGVRQRGRRPGAEHDATGEAAQPDPVAPPEPRELHARDDPEEREPGLEEPHRPDPEGHGRRRDRVAIATLIDVKNQEGVAMASARPARAASASATSASRPTSRRGRRAAGRTTGWRATRGRRRTRRGPSTWPGRAISRALPSGSVVRGPRTIVQPARPVRPQGSTWTESVYRGAGLTEVGRHEAGRGHATRPLLDPVGDSGASPRIHERRSGRSAARGHSTMAPRRPLSCRG